MLVIIEGVINVDVLFSNMLREYVCQIQISFPRLSFLLPKTPDFRKIFILYVDVNLLLDSLDSQSSITAPLESLQVVHNLMVLS